MPKISKIQKEEIIKTSFAITKESGIEKVNAREIAKRLNSSIQPVYYQFNTMDELRKELLDYTLDYFNQFIFKFEGDDPKYKQTGINYIRFAREEPNLFKFIFMGNYKIKIEDFEYFEKSYKEAEIILQAQNKIDEETIKDFHLKMWMFIHGIACLIATNTVSFTNEKISSLLTDEFLALLNSVIKK